VASLRTGPTVSKAAPSTCTPSPLNTLAAQRPRRASTRTAPIRRFLLHGTTCTSPVSQIPAREFVSAGCLLYRYREHPLPVDETAAYEQTRRFLAMGRFPSADDVACQVDTKSPTTVTSRL